MFDEHAAISVDPQAISAAPTPVIQDIVDHHGAVNLVKRLATLLAERDAHITALKRLAEAYNAPADKIGQTATRARQTEDIRVSLTAAAQATDLPDGEPLEATVSILVHCFNVHATIC